MTHQEVAIEFLRQAASGRARPAFAAHVARGFRHHNPYFRGDAHTLMAAMDENARQNPQRVLEIKHALEDDDLVAVHSRVSQKPNGPGGAVVHVFRFEGDKIAEL